jgi:hypothetical protein
LQYLKPLPEKILRVVQAQRNINSKRNGKAGDLADLKSKIKKGSRNTILFKKACSLLNKGLSKNETLAVIKEINQKKCDPPIGKAEISGILKSASGYEPDNDQTGDKIPKEIKELNKKHAILNLDGRYMILNILPDTLKDQKVSLETRLKAYSNSPIYSLSTEIDFKKFYRTSVITNLEGKKSLLTNAWLKSPHVKKFDGLAFEPGKALEDRFNLWTGFAIEEQEPIEGKRSCEKFLGHIKYGWANGNEELYEWILDFLAYPLQYPGGSKAGVALFLLGEQGTGKTLLSKIYGMLFGRHFVHIQAPEQITGRFNRHLSATIVVLADEVTWGGDRKSVNRLKALVTEETFMCEPKGIDSYSVSNYMNFIITSNDDFVIRTASDERRFCIIPVSNYHKQDHNYFKNIVEEMEKGGLGALIYKLRRRELSLERLRKLPTTSATIDHKIRSMNIVQQYWFERLKTGTTIDTQYHQTEYAFYSKLATDELITRYQCKWMGNELDESERFAVKGIVYADFMLFRRQFKYDRENLPRQEFFRKLYSCCSGLRPSQNYELIGVPEVKERVTTIRIPPLEICREEFERMIGYKIEWGDFEGMENFE